MTWQRHKIERGRYLSPNSYYHAYVIRVSMQNVVNANHVQLQLQLFMESKHGEQHVTQ